MVYIYKYTITIFGLLLLLSSNAITIRRDKSILYARTTISLLITSFIILIWNFDFNFFEKNIGLFDGFFHVSSLTYIFHLFIIIVTILVLQLNGFYPRKVIFKNESIYLIFNKINYFNSYILNKLAEQFRIIEYPLLILFILIGGIFLLSSSDFISVFLCIELQSYGLYILSTVYRNSERATSGGLTYFLLGGLSSCFILLSSSILYSNTGNTSFDSMYIIGNISNESIINKDLFNYFNMFYDSNYFNYAFVILAVGLLFKIAAAPFHFWSPDVYDAIPTVVTTFVAIFAKISIFVLLLELVYYSSNYIYDTEINGQMFSWTIVLLISSLLSLIIGSLLGMVQFRIKRLYAYSTISHVGFILLGLSINTVESIQSFIFYLTQYSLSNLNAFIILLSIGYSLYIYKEKNENDLEMNNNIIDRKNSPIQLISQLKGYFYINPLLAVSFAITIFSFVGIPPLVGFFGKQMILSSALDNGYVFMSLVAILTSVISAYYYLSLIKQMFFNITDYIINFSLKDLSINIDVISRFNNKLKENSSVSIDNIAISSYLALTISIITLLMLLFIINPQEWLNLAMILSLSIFTC